MHRRHLRQAPPLRPLILGAGALLFALASVRAAHASPRIWQPLIAKGAQFPALLGTRIDRLEVFAAHGGKLAPIPFQVDEVLPDGSYVLPDGPAPNRAEHPGILVNEDEIVMMMGDLGERALGNPRMPPGAQEIEVDDPLGGAPRYAYLAGVDAPVRSPIRYIEYASGRDVIETDHYRISFTHEFPTDFAIQERMHSGAPNLIDRFKVRVRARVLGFFRFTLDEDDVHNRLLAWRAGPIRVIRRLSHSADLIFGIRSPQVMSANSFYRDYIDNPFKLHFPWVPRLLFGDIHLRIDLDFTRLDGYRLLWSGMKGPPLAIGDGAGERKLAAEDPPPRVTWIAFEGRGRVIVQTLAPNNDLSLLDRRLYFRDDPRVPDPPERVRGEHPGIGYVLTGWEGLSRGTHALDSLLVDAPADYDPDVLLEELRTPPVARVSPAADARSAALAVCHDLEQVAVGIEKVEAVVVAPVDGLGRFDAGGCQTPRRGQKVRVVHAKGMVAAAERMRDSGTSLLRR
jgi:hypothetical protein